MSYDIATTVSRVANETYSHTRRIMPEQPWWNHLESSFHKFPDDFELDLRTELTVEGTAWADVPLSWRCPDCGAGKEDFEMVEV